MIDVYIDYRKKQYIVEIDSEDIKRAVMSQTEYNNLICRISKAIYTEMRFNDEHLYI